MGLMIQKEKVLNYFFWLRFFCCCFFFFYTINIYFFMAIEFETESNIFKLSCNLNTLDQNHFSPSIFTPIYESKIYPNTKEAANFNNLPIGTSIIEPKKNIPSIFFKKKTEKSEKKGISFESTIKELNEDTVHNFETQKGHNNDRKITSDIEKHLYDNEDVNVLRNNMSHTNKMKNKDEINSDNLNFKNDDKISFAVLFDISDIKDHKKFSTTNGISRHNNKNSVISVSKSLNNEKYLINHMDSTNNDEEKNLKNTLSLDRLNTNDILIEQKVSSFEYDKRSSKETSYLNQQSTIENEDIMEINRNEDKLHHSFLEIAKKNKGETEDEYFSYEDLNNNIL